MPEKRRWHNTTAITSESFVCGFCGNLVATSEGSSSLFNRGNAYGGAIRIYPHCDSPTCFDPDGRRFPTAPPGKPVAGVPKDTNDLYEEARRSAGASAPTGSVLLCRKVLMHIAVEKGADPGKSFLSYIDHLQSKGYIPPDGRERVDYIRSRSNEANHDVIEFTLQDAVALIELTEMLLRVIYEFPSRVPRKPAAK